MNAKTLIGKGPIGAWLILLFCMQIVHAQSTQNLKREMLFRLGENEQVLYNEYAAQMAFGGNKFAVVIHDKVKDEFRFEFNGRRIATSNYAPFSVAYLDPTREDGYAFSWHTVSGADTTTRVNIKGKVYGPYEEAYVMGENEFWYSLAGQYYFKNESHVYGPFPRMCSPLRTFSNGNYIGISYQYYNKINYGYVNINGTESQYQNLYGIMIHDSGTYAFQYWYNNDAQYANINGKTFGPYHFIQAIAIDGNGKFGFVYRTRHKIEGGYGYDWQYHLNINGTVKQVDIPNNAVNITISATGDLAYSYFDSEAKAYFVRINEITYGPYPNIRTIRLGANGHFGYTYDDENRGYAIVDGKSHGPYNNITLTGLDDRGNYKLYADGKLFVNGVETIEEKEDRYYLANVADGQTLRSDDGHHSFYSNHAYDYVVIDGQQVGNSPALHVSYDAPKNAFVWNAIEGKELVVYEYRL